MHLQNPNLTDVNSKCHPDIREFHQLWSKACHRRPPGRDHLPDEVFTRFNAGISIAEFDYRSETLTYRVASPMLIDLLSCDPTGKPVRDFFRGSEWLEIWKNYCETIEKQKPVYSRSNVYSTRNRPNDVETLYLPLEAGASTFADVLTFSV